MTREMVRPSRYYMKSAVGKSEYDFFTERCPDDKSLPHRTEDIFIAEDDAFGLKEEVGKLEGVPMCQKKEGLNKPYILGQLTSLPRPSRRRTARRTMAIPVSKAKVEGSGTRTSCARSSPAG